MNMRSVRAAFKCHLQGFDFSLYSRLDNRNKGGGRGGGMASNRELPVPEEWGEGGGRHEARGCDRSSWKRLQLDCVGIFRRLVLLDEGHDAAVMRDV
jgi:hypothetical protein